MDKYWNNFAKKYVEVAREQVLPVFLRENRNIFREIQQENSFTSAYLKYSHFFQSTGNADELIAYAIISNTEKSINFTESEINSLSQKLGFRNSSNSSNDAFRNGITDLKSRYDKLTTSYMEIGQRILYFDTNIQSFGEIPYEITDTKHTINYKITLKSTGLHLNSKDAYMIFNQTPVNKRIPIIIFTNSKGKKYTRVAPDIEKFPKELFDESFPLNSVSFFVDKQIITLNTLTSSFSITVDSKQDETLRVLWMEKNFPFDKLFPYLQFEQLLKRDKIIGKISFDTRIDVNILYKLILIDPWFSFFFYIDENGTPWAGKPSKYKVNFRDYNPSLLIQTEYVKNNMSDFTTRYSVSPDAYFDIPVNVNEKDIGLSFKFTAVTEFELSNFAYRFSHLLSYYFQQYPSNNLNNVSVNTSSTLGTSFKVYVKSSEEVKDKGKILFTHLRKRKGQEKEIEDTKNYSETCYHLPTIIEPEEIPEWEAYGREVAEFPPRHIPSEDRLFFVCPLDKYPSVYLQDNKQRSSSKYPYVPCCSKKTKKYSELTLYKNFENVENQDKKSKNNRELISEAVLSYGSIGLLNDYLSSFLKQAFGGNIETKFYRTGVINKNYDPNSFILAVMHAFPSLINQMAQMAQMNQLNQFSQPNQPSQVSQNGIIDVYSIRQIMAGIKINPYTNTYLDLNIYRQELYDWTNEHIKDYLLNEKNFIDPYLFYRGLEELFGISIYVFGKIEDSSYSHPISFNEKNVSFPILEIPRCRYMHIRYPKTGYTVCIYKNYGTERSKSIIPVCELIKCSPSKGEYISAFSDFSFNETLYKHSKEIAHPIEWDKTTIGSPISSNCYDDPYDTNWSLYLDNMLQILGPLKGQEIDGYGKMVSLIFNEWTIGIPPAQPMNLPIIDRPSYFDICKVTQVFNLDKFLSDEDGIWLPYNGNNKGIKIYCLTDKPYENFNILSSLTDITDNKNKASILMQIINWLWRSDFINNNSVKFKSWWSDHTSIDTPEIFTYIPMPSVSCNNRGFPEGNDFSTRIKQIAAWWPFFFYQQKIHVSPELFNRISNYFTREEILTYGLKSDNLLIAPPPFITDLIPTSSDFKIYSDIIFDNNDSIKEWLYFTHNEIFSRPSLKNMNIIYTYIDSQLTQSKEPFLFKDDYGKIYIIQNSTIPNNGLISSLQIARYWRDNSRNPGHSYFIEEDNPRVDREKYVLYILDQKGNIFPVDSFIGYTPPYLQIIQYNINIYGAMLPIF